MTVIQSLKIGVLLFVPLILNPISAQDRVVKDSQEAYEFFNAAYGKNPALVNGKYFVDMSGRDLGDPFYNKKAFVRGYVVINGQKFTDQKIMYNIFDQHLVVDISNNNNEPFAFIPPNALISEFSIQNQIFNFYSLEGYKGYLKPLYKNDQIEYVVGYSKNRTDSYHNTGFKAYKYSLQKRTYYYIAATDKLIELKSKKDMLNLYAVDHSKTIKKYLKANKISFRRSSEETITELIHYCENL